MANRYQSFSFTTASVASGVVLQASQVLGPHVYNLVKLKIVRNTGNGNINFRVFKKGVWGSANRLIRFENQAVPLLHPVDKTSGSPGIEALEGIPLPVDDEDGTNNDGAGKLHHELENLGTTSTFTISGEYEEVVVLSSAGDPSWRGAVSALTSLSLRGATSGTAIIAAPAVAGTPTLTLPTASGTFARLQDKLSAFAATTSAELAGVISDETGSGALVFATSPTFVTPTLGVATATSIAIGANTLDTNEWANLDGINQTLATTSTPQFARLGLGIAADASIPLNLGTDINVHHIRLAGYSGLQAATSGAQVWLMSNNYFDGTNYKYITTFAASQVSLASGQVQLLAAASGTAGTNITWSTRLTVNSTGIGFFATTPVALQTSGANLTNNVTSGGSNDVIADFTSLSVYATDAAAIRNDIYQLARKLKQINDGLRAYGLFT